MMRLQVGEAHLDALALIARLEECLSAHLATRHVAGILVEITRDLARGCLRAALGFEWTDVAVKLAGAVEQRPTAMDGAAGSQHLAVGALGPKQLQLLSELVPNVTVVVLMVNPQSP